MSQRSTKDKILMVLKKRHELSMKELVTYFTISETAVRKQLNELLRQDFAQERIVKKEIGRPYYLYKLTSKGHEAFPNHNDQLPIQLLEDLKESEGEAAVSRLLKTRQVREAKELREVTPADSFKNKIEQLIAYQEEKGYIIDMDEDEEGNIQIINYHCPIFNLASEYDVICSHEREIYRDIFPDSEVISHENLSAGGKCCKWTITNPDKKQKHKGM